MANTADVLVYEPSYRRIRERFEQALPGVRVILMGEDGSFNLDGQPVDLERIAPTAGWATFDMFRGEHARDFITALLKSTSLRWVQTSAAGIDNPVFARLMAKGIVLSNSNAQAPAIAEYTFAGVLEHFQKSAERRAAQARSEWRPIPYREVAGTHWLVVGYGNIGREIAKRARAFGAHVTGLRRNARMDDLAHEVETLDRLPQWLPQADVVVLCCALNAQTQGLANAEFFARMKPGGILFNVGRGGLLDETALLAALDKGIPERAVLDVFQTEPLPAASPLWRHARVQLTAHGSALGDGMTRRADELFIDNLGRFARGEPLRNVVDPKDLFNPA